MIIEEFGTMNHPYRKLPFLALFAFLAALSIGAAALGDNPPREEEEYPCELSAEGP